MKKHWLEQFLDPAAAGKSGILQPHEMIYEDRLLFFIDILGWSQAISQSITDDGEFKKLTFVATALETFLVDSVHESQGVTAAFFSDTLIASWVPRDPSHTTWYLLKLASLLNDILCWHGYYSRGSIVYGKLFHNGSIVFGPALLDAYHLEKAAIVPRILVADTAKRFLDESSSRYAHNFFSDSWYLTDEDNNSFLDTLRFGMTDGLKDIIEEYMIRDAGNSNLERKHKWMLNYLLFVETRRATRTKPQR